MDTIRSLPSGAGLLPPSGRSRAAGTPWASSTAHICGSQDTIASADAWPAIQTAAAVRAAAAARMAAGVGVPPVLARVPPFPAWAAPREGPVPDWLLASAMVMAPAPNSTAARTSTVSTRHRAWAGQWRCTQSRTVVTSTLPQDGGREAGRGGPAGLAPPAAPRAGAVSPRRGPGEPGARPAGLRAEARGRRGRWREARRGAGPARVSPARLTPSRPGCPRHPRRGARLPGPAGPAGPLPGRRRDPARTRSRRPRERPR